MTELQTPEQIHQQRAPVHGRFEDNARLTELFNNTAKQGPNYDNLSSVERTAMWVILHKLARVLSGNPHYDDHWADIAGYAELVRKDNKEKARG